MNEKSENPVTSWTGPIEVKEKPEPIEPGGVVTGNKPIEVEEKAEPLEEGGVVTGNVPIVPPGGAAEQNPVTGWTDRSPTYQQDKNAVGGREEENHS